jgi:predicted metal-dependent hydrolase
MDNLHKYFNGYSTQLQQQVQSLIENGNLKSYLLNKYPDGHEVNNDKLLYEYANSLKQRYLKKAPSLSRVIYEKQKDLVQNALGTHSFISRNHGGKLKSKHEIRISNQLKEAPKEMLELLVIHELAHFKEKDHNKSFYKLCEYMRPDYHQIELDLRMFLVLSEMGDSLYPSREN